MADSLKSFISGGFGGACVVIVGHPLDTIKVRLQNDKPPPNNEFNGMMDCGRKMIAKDGIRRGLYRGMSAPLVAVTPIFAVYFWGFDMGKKIWKSAAGTPDSLSTAGIIFAGGFSALPGTLVMVPGDLIKVKLQSEPATGKPPRFTNPINCASWILANEGPKGLFRGTALTLLRDVPGSVAYYTTYELVKQKLVDMAKDPAASGPPKLSPVAIMTAGGLSGVANWLVAVPPDVVKSRFQAAAPGTYPGGLRQVARELFQQEGLGAFFKGLAPALTRAFPANAACFLGMEVSRKALDSII